MDDDVIITLACITKAKSENPAAKKGANTIRIGERAKGIRHKLAVLAAVSAMLAAPVFATAAEAGSRAYHRHFAYRPVYRTYGNGWRHRSNARGWDNSCLNLPYLPSQFACDAR